MGMLYEYNDEDQIRLFPEVVSARKKLASTERSGVEASKLRLEDVGTRHRHLTELLDLWEAGVDVMDRYNLNSDKDRKKKLESAVELLRKHIDHLSGYDYRAWNIRDEIEHISRDPAKIVGGRGTPLKQPPLGSEE
jgi:hypothetical protein